jgi:hypothetical protein
MTTSAIAHQAAREGRATVDELASIADAWRAWGASADGWFAVLHGEIICIAQRHCLLARSSVAFCPRRAHLLGLAFDIVKLINRRRLELDYDPPRMHPARALR